MTKQLLPLEEVIKTLCDELEPQNGSETSWLITRRKCICHVRELWLSGYIEIRGRPWDEVSNLPVGDAANIQPHTDMHFDHAGDAYLILIHQRAKKSSGRLGLPIAAWGELAISAKDRARIACEQKPVAADARSQPGAAPQPAGISARASQDYLDATALDPDFMKNRGGISKVARAVAKAAGRECSTVRRNLQRVLKRQRETV